MIYEKYTRFIDAALMNIIHQKHGKILPMQLTDRSGIDSYLSDES